MRPVRPGHLGLGLGGRVEVRSLGRELGRAGIDHLVPGPAQDLTEHGQVHAREFHDLGVGEAVSPGEPQVSLGRSFRVTETALERDDILNLLEEERGDVGEPRDLLDLKPLPERIEEAAEALVCRMREEHADLVPIGVDHDVRVERAEGLLERLLDRPADRHHLAGRLHRGRERPVRVRELVEGPARDLDHDVVDRGLERGRRAASDRVGDLVEGQADCDLRGNARDRVPGRLGGEGR